MKAAVDCRYIRERPSGIGRYADALVEYVPALAPEDQFVLWTHRLANLPLSRASNVSHQIVPIEPNSLWTILWPERYASFEGVDLFHAQNILPRNLPCPSVVTLHDIMEVEAAHLVDWTLDDTVKRFFFPRAMWRAIRQATRLIVTTCAMADSVCRKFPPARDRIRVTPLAAGPRFTPPASEEIARHEAVKIIGSEAPYVLVVGQNSRNKRHRVALQAFARGAPSSWHLVLVQRQQKKGGLQALAHELQIEGRVHFLSTLEIEKIIALYQAAQVLLQPSIYEGFGLPILEAMACGCPVIASDLLTLREVLADSAILVKPDDVRAFGSALTEISRSKDHFAERRASAVAHAAKFSWKRCAEQTLEVYREAASIGAARPRPVADAAISTF
jgi:glycosyltransferase involved in cell wall biosynthesis